MTSRKLIGALALSLLLAAGSVSAQSTTSTTTVGTPNTGVGGNAGTNALILGSTAAIALLGAAYLARRQAE